MKKEINLNLNKIGKTVAKVMAIVGLITGLLIGLNSFYNSYYLKVQSPVILRSPILIEERKPEIIEIEKIIEPEEQEEGEEVTEVEPTPAPAKTSWTGKASWYGSGEGECLGCRPYYREDGSVYYRMANGQILDDTQMTVAFNRAPLGSQLRITNLENNSVTYATVADTGGFEELKDPKIVDVTKAVKQALNMNENIMVQIELIN